MNNHLSKIFSPLAILFLLPVLSVYSQTLDRDSFVIVKEFVPTLTQASKIRINPEISDTHHLDLDLKYTFLDKKIESKYVPEVIKPATLKGEPLVKLHKNYLILGYGNNNTPLAEYYFNQVRSKSVSYVLYGRHLSSSGIAGLENSGFSNNKLGMEGNYYTRKLTCTGRINYSYDHVNYFGFNKDISGLNLSETEKNEDVMQFYNQFNAAAGIGNNQRDTIGLRHYSEISFNHIEDRYGVAENRFLFTQTINALNKADVYLFDWAIDYNKYYTANDLNLDSNYENSLVYLKPGIHLKGAKWNLTGKLNIVGDFDRKTRFHLYPVAEFKFNLIRSVVIPYAGIKGNMHRNTYASFVGENPFISPLIGLENTNEKISVYAGIGGNLSKNTSFDLSFSQSDFENMALFVKDTLSREMRAFTVVYDNVKLTKMTAEIIYEPLKRWNLALRGDYYMYDTEDQLEAWHKPDYRISALLGYNLGNKILVKLMAYVIGAQKARLYEKAESETLAGTADVNLDGEYRYSKKISVFLQLNNLASIQYEKYQDYPTQRLNALAGFKFSF